MRISGPILVLSGLLFVLFLVLYLLGGDRATDPAETTVDPPATTVGDRERIRQMLSGDFKREPKKNVAMGQGRLRCIVRDSSGAAAPGSSVEVTPLVPDASILAPRPEYQHYWEAGVSATGYVEFRELPAGDFLVVASREGAHGLAQVQVHESGVFAEAELVLAPAAPRSGTVRNANGGALAGAVIVPIRAGDWVGDSSPYRYMPVEAGEDGQFTHPLLPTGTWHMLVASDGFAPSLVRVPDGGGFEVRLNEGEALVAAVVRSDNQRPLSSAKVLLDARDAPGESYSARSTGQGLVSFERLRATAYTMTLVSDAFTGQATIEIAGQAHDAATSPATPEARSMRLDPLSGSAVGIGVPDAEIVTDDTNVPPAPVQLTAYPAASVRGRVLAANADIGIAGVGVAAFREGAPEPVCTAVSDGAGYYHLKPLVAGTVEIVVPRTFENVYTATGESRIEVAAGGITPGPEFRERPGVSLSGLVVDDANSPIPEANIEIELVNVPGEVLRRGSGAEGKFEITGMFETDQVLLTAVRLGEKSAPFGPVTVGERGLREILLRIGSE